MEPELERPLASEESEARIKDTFPLTVSPEEFAARDGHGWLDFPFSRNRYRDAELDVWVQRVGEILANPEKLREYRNKYLTPAEMSLILRYLADDDDEIDAD